MGKAFMKCDATMVLLRDEMHGRLLLRFCSLHEELGGPTGYLGSFAGLWLSNRRYFGKVNRVGVHTVLHPQVGEAQNHYRVGGVGGGS